MAHSTQFRLLGPLDVARGTRPVPLGGVKQRATLGFLLLKANQVVPTSTLLKALWTEEEAPASARKMLQNAVWGLRATLGSAGCADVQLSTQSPGYVLKVAQDSLDLNQFTAVAGEGRSLLGAGEYDRAADVLSSALAIWRGGALADLAEAGVSWPEMAGLENSRLATMEDYFDAELGRGRHYEVLADLETLVETERLRERACRQLMLALYRCGRHADALGVFGRLRAALVDDLGLEPGPELRALQQAILNHDPTLALAPQPVEATRPVEPAEVETADPAAPGASEAQRAATLAVSATGTAPGMPVRRAAATVPVASVEPVSPFPVIPRPRRDTFTLAMIRVGLGRDCAEVSSAELDDLIAGASAVVRAGVEQLDGRVLSSIGSDMLVLFASPGRVEDAALRAVRSAVLLRDSLVDGDRGLVITTTLCTGEVLLDTPSGDQAVAPVPRGALVDRLRDLLARVPDRQVWVCATTHRAVAPATLCAPVGPDVWEVRSAQEHDNDPHRDHECDLHVVRGLLDRTRKRRRPHLVTLLSDTTAAVTSFLDALEEQIDSAATLLVRSRCTDDLPLFAPAHAIADLYNGTAARAKAPTGPTLESTLESALRGARILPFDRSGSTARQLPADTTWQGALQSATRDRAVVVVLEDAHTATDEMLDWIENWVGTAMSAPLLVVVAGSSELTTRRPDWGAGIPHTASITLDHAGEAGDAERLRDTILSTLDEWARPLAARLMPATAETLSPRAGDPIDSALLRLDIPVPPFQSPRDRLLTRPLGQTPTAASM